MELKPSMLIVYTNGLIYKLIAENGQNASEWYGESLYDADGTEHWLLTEYARPFYLQIGDIISMLESIQRTDLIIAEIENLRYTQRGTLIVDYKTFGNKNSAEELFRKRYIEHI